MYRIKKEEAQSPPPLYYDAGQDDKKTVKLLHPEVKVNFPKGAIPNPIALPNQPGVISVRDRLPQMQVHNKRSESASNATRTFPPILFDWHEEPTGWGVHLPELTMKSVGYIANEMVGGHDRLFASYTTMKSINFRIGWIGYSNVEWIRGIELNTPFGPITRAGLAVEVAHQVSRFIGQVSYVPIEPKYVDWAIDSPNGIRFDHLYLVSLVNVANSTWQADIIVQREYSPKAMKYRKA